jgi:hypothetical protein
MNTRNALVLAFVGSVVSACSSATPSTEPGSVTTQYDGQFTARATRTASGEVTATLSDDASRTLASLTTSGDTTTVVLDDGTSQSVTLQNDTTLAGIDASLWLIWSEHVHGPEQSASPSSDVEIESAESPAACSVSYGGHCAMTCHCWEGSPNCIVCCSQDDGSALCGST